MAFVTLPFILFIGATAVLYFLVPKRVQWIVLLAASLIFFWLNSEWLVLIMLGQTLITFYTAKGIASVQMKGKLELKEKKDDLTADERKALKGRTKKKSKRLLVVGILINLGVLAFLKYSGIFVTGSNLLLRRFGIEIPRFRFLLPIGISFYTLQAISYMTDVYRAKIEPDRNIAKFTLFMSYFPQILQGPIPRYNQLAGQLYEGHKYDYQRVCFGAQLILWGFFQKLVIADRMGVAVDYIFSHRGSFHGAEVWFAVALYGIQMYADFAGGIEIARGVSQIFGIELTKNFEQPYFSRSLEEFWRRWHISLGDWMKDYVFYPLSLSKASTRLGKRARKWFGDYLGKRIPSYLATFIVFLLVGVWHGSSLKYVAYGIWNGGVIVSSLLLAGVYAKVRGFLGIKEDMFSFRVFQMLRTFLVVTCGRFFDRASTFRTGYAMLKSAFVGWWDFSFFVDGTLAETGLNTANWIVLLLAVLVLLFVDYLHTKDIRIRNKIAEQPLVFRWIIYYAAILIVFVYGVWGPHYDSVSFMYEQF